MCGTRLFPGFLIAMHCMISGTDAGMAQEAPDGEPVLGHVRSAALDAFSLEVEVELPVNVLVPGQGRATHLVRATISDAVTAIVWKATQLPAPVYHPAGPPGNRPMCYDRDGNLGVGMPREGATVRNSVGCDEYSESMGFRVGPDGSILRKTSGKGGLLNRWEPSHTNTVNLNKLRRILWALGRPPADSFAEPISEEMQGDGTCHLRALGGWGSGGRSAICDLVIEPSSGFLVREARFGAEGEAPRSECHSQGTRRFGDVVLAERGEFTVHPVETISVRLISFSPTVSEEIIQDAQQIIARAETRTVQVFDYRDDPRHAKIHTFAPGELDLGWKDWDE